MSLIKVVSRWLGPTLAHDGRMRVTILALVLTLVNAQAAGNLTDRLVLHLPLTEDLEDHSPLRQAVEIVGAVRIEPEGAYFGGRKDWLEAPFIALNDRPFAVAMWIKESARTRQVGLIEQYDLSQRGHHLHLMLRENRQPYFGLLGRDQISPVGVPWEQQWMHLVFQHTGEFQQIWINGRLVASFRAEPYHGTTGVTAIGKAPRWGNVPARDFVGHMRDVRIYQRRLELDEIASLANAFEVGQTITSTAAADDRAPQSPGATMALSPTLAAMLPEDPSRPFLEIDGQQITINGRPGQVYVLESSTDLRNWVPLERGGSETGTMVYQDPDRDSAMRFYRVRVEEKEGLW